MTTAKTTDIDPSSEDTSQKEKTRWFNPTRLLERLWDAVTGIPAIFCLLIAIAIIIIVIVVAILLLVSGIAAVFGSIVGAALVVLAFLVVLIIVGIVALIVPATIFVTFVFINSLFGEKSAGQQIKEALGNM